MAETKKCEVCDQEIGITEKVCPKCQTDFEELEQEVSVVTRAQKVVAARKAKEIPLLPPPPPPPAKKKSVFGSLGKKG